MKPLVLHRISYLKLSLESVVEQSRDIECLLLCHSLYNPETVSTVSSNKTNLGYGEDYRTDFGKNFRLRLYDLSVLSEERTVYSQLISRISPSEDSQRITF